jgi:hypothetical protein
MAKPNFLLVGAQKAGSTSLYNYLKEHPQVFMPPRKEPLYFTSEIAKVKQEDKWMQEAIKKANGKTYIDNYSEYLELFKDVKNEIAIGEASANYLYYHQTSIPKIKEKLGNIKILIILRSPVDKIFSQYKFLRKGGAEPYSFIKALEKEPERIKQNYNALYHYISQGLYFKQIKAFFDNFSDVKVVLLEDLKKEPAKCMRSVFEFLSVDSYYTISDYKVHFKTSHIPKSKQLQDILNKDKYIVSFRQFIKRSFPGIYKKSGKVYKSINSSNPILSDEAKEILYDRLYDDILKLELFLEVDLKTWKESFK